MKQPMIALKKSKATEDGEMEKKKEKRERELELENFILQGL